MKKAILVFILICFIVLLLSCEEYDNKIKIITARVMERRFEPGNYITIKNAYYVYFLSDDGVYYYINNNLYFSVLRAGDLVVIDVGENPINKTTGYIRRVKSIKKIKER